MLFDYGDHITAHELKHAYQFETGELSITGVGEGKSIFYDRGDEEAAVQRGTLYKGKTWDKVKDHYYYLDEGRQGVMPGFKNQFPIEKLLEWSESSYFKVDGILYGPKINH